MSAKKKLIATVSQEEKARTITVRLPLQEVFKQVSPLGDKLFSPGEEIGVTLKLTPEGEVLILIGPESALQPPWGYPGMAGSENQKERSSQEERSSLKLNPVLITEFRSRSPTRPTYPPRILPWLPQGKRACSGIRYPEREAGCSPSAPA